jgi:type I restriction enzyme S subunit
VSITFLEVLEQSANSRDAVPAFRTFLLRLALRGGLVPRNLDDGDARALLAAVPGNPELDGATLGDFGEFEIPPHWVWVRMQDIGRVVGGGTPPSGDADCFAPPGSNIGWLTPADLGQQRSKTYVAHGRRDITPRGLSLSGARLIPAGSVLFTSRAPIGYVAIAEKELTTNQGFKSVIPSATVTSGYVALYFRGFGPLIDSRAPGTTFREVSGKIVASLPFPLPPLDEQHRIVAKVDELMRLCDRLETAQLNQEARRDLLRATTLRMLAAPGQPRDHAQFFLSHSPRMLASPEHVADVRQAIRELAVRGRLVPQDADDEPAAALVRSIRSKKSGTRSRAQAAVGTDYDAGTYPATWAPTSIGTLFDVYVGSTPPRTDPSLWGGEIPWVSSGEVAFNRIESTRESITQKAVGTSSTRIHPPGTVMLSMIGQGKTRGQAAILQISAAHNQNCASIRVSETRISPEYIYLVLAERYERTRLQAEGGSQPALNSAKVRAICFGLPPLAEQRRIISRLDELMSVCDELEQCLARERTARARLLEASLHDALAGGLRAQLAFSAI